MATSSRLTTASNGQLSDEFRSRDQSGILTARRTALHEQIIDVGVPCWAFGQTSAALHGFDGFRLSKHSDLVIERGHNVRRIGHTIHTSMSIPLIDRSLPHGIPALSPTRTLVTIAGTHTREQVTTALDGAIRDGLTTEDFLHRRIAALRTSGRDGIRGMLEVIEGVEVTRGGQSWLEREFLRLISVSGVAAPATQQILGRRGDRLIRVDFHFPGTNVVVEVLGYRYHRTPSQLIGDAERMNRLQPDGFHVLQFTYHHVVSDGPAVVRTFLEALTGRRAA
jgi:very-short-patch-repair endonuclease